MSTGRQIEFDPSIAALFAIMPHDGWIGAFTTGTYPGALINGTRIVKVLEDPSGDRTPLGTCGRVLGSIGHPTLGVFYFIEWDNAPRIAVGCYAKKIRPV